MAVEKHFNKEKSKNLKLRKVFVVLFRICLFSHGMSLAKEANIDDLKK